MNNHNNIQFNRAHNLHYNPQFNPNMNYNYKYNQNIQLNNPHVTNTKSFFLFNFKLKVKHPIKQKIDLSSKLIQFDNFGKKINEQFLLLFKENILANYDKIHTCYSDTRQNLFDHINNFNNNASENLERLKSKVLDILGNIDPTFSIEFSNKNEAIEFINKYKFQLLLFLFKFIIKIPLNLISSVCQFIENKISVERSDTMVHKNKTSLSAELEEKCAIKNNDFTNEKKADQYNIEPPSNNKKDLHCTPDGDNLMKKQIFLDKQMNMELFNTNIMVPKDYKFNQKEISDFKFYINNQTINDKIVLQFLFNTKLILAIENYFKCYYKSESLIVVYVFPDLYEKQEEFAFINKTVDLLSKPIEYGFRNFRLFYQYNPFIVNNEEIKIVGAIYLPQYTRLNIRLN